MTPHYSMVIQWSDEDQTFVVSLPEFGLFCQTHGDTYAEAVQNGEQVIEMLVSSAKDRGEALPAARVYHPTYAA